MKIIEHLSQIFLISLTLKYVIQQYLTRRNIKYILAHSEEVPAEFKSFITLEEHQKAADYTIEKSKFSMLERVISIIVILVWLPLGYAGQLDLYLSTFNFHPWVTGLIFWGLITLVGIIIDIPFSYIRNFGIEAKYGFNKMTKKLFFIDIIKQLFLSTLLGVPLLLFIFWITSATDLWWLYAWMFFVGFQFLLMWAWPKFIAPLFNKFYEMEDQELKNLISDLCHKIDFKQNGIYIMDASIRSSHGNAYFTGFGKNKRIVFFDTLIKSLEPLQLQAVLAHELGHFKLKHILKMMIFSLLSTFIGFWILGHLYNDYLFYLNFKFIQPSPHAALFIFTSITPIILFPLTPIFSFLSRRNEYQADKFAATYTKADQLAEALVKLYKNNFSTLTPDPIFSKFYNSHPTAIERIRFLKSLS